MYYHVNYCQDPQEKIVEIRVAIVEGDHVGPEQIFLGDQAVEQLRSWVARQPKIDSYSTDQFWDLARMARVYEMLTGGEVKNG